MASGIFLMFLPMSAFAQSGHRVKALHFGELLLRKIAIEPHFANPGFLFELRLL